MRSVLRYLNRIIYIYIFKGSWQISALGGVTCEEQDRYPYLSGYCLHFKNILS